MNSKTVFLIVVLLCSVNLIFSQHKWGRLANPGFIDRPVKSTFFFAGNWRNGVQFYEYNPGSNTHLYTIHPSDSRHLGWSEQLAFREFAVETMIETGINVVNMSYWGPRGTDNWAWWAPMQTSTYAHDQLFDLAVDRHVLIAPYIESYAATSNSPAFFFRQDFPGTEQNPAPLLVARLVELIDRYILNPENPDWPYQWAQIYNREGQPRYVVSIIHVSSDQAGVTDQSFANGFDRVANKVYQQTGIEIGFTLDILSSGTYAPGVFKPSAQGTGPFLAQQNSLLAIQCFIPEIWLGSGNERYLSQWKNTFSGNWIQTGIPFILDVAPGYDAHIVFPGSVVYGNSDYWRTTQKDMLKNLACDGLTLNAWNGYTEGFAGMPTLQYGDVNHLWAETLFRMTDDKHPMELVYEFSTKGWTLISLPGVADDMSVGALFPDLKYDWALTYNQGYLKTSTLEPNKGYWLYIKEPTRQHLDVLPVYAVSYTFDKPGWYLMGGIAEAKDFSEPVCTPPNGVQPPVYAYDPGSGSYLTTNVLEPQTGYWMMISNACELNVSPDYLTPLARPSKDKWLSSIPPLLPDIQEIERDREHNKEQYRLDNYPNPFNTSTTISFYLKKYTHVNLSVFNSHGQWVQTLIDQGSSPGTHTVYWNGKNQNGADVASGVYIAMLEKNGSRQIKKLMLLR